MTFAEDPHVFRAGASPSRSLVHQHLDPLDLAYSKDSLIGRSLESTDYTLGALTHLRLSSRARFVLHGLGTALAPHFRCVHHAFRAHATERPSALALEHGTQTLCYGGLDARSDALAHILRARGVRPGSRVCLLVQRSIAMVIGILAVLKAGASYVPLDGGIVTDMALRFILKDSEAKLVLCLDAFGHRVPGDVPQISLDAFMRSETALNAEFGPLFDMSAPSDEAYVIYTSGTTGTPKGVSVRHCNLVNLLCLAPGRLGMKPGARVSQLMNVAFDMCAWEVLGALANGSTLCLRGHGKDHWRGVLRNVDVVIATPSILSAYRAADFPNIRHVATAGEPCPQRLADEWSQSVSFYDCCGPTEVTIVNTIHRHRSGDPVSIGTPTPNNHLYVLDNNMRPVEIGDAGTMWASGAGTSGGYLNLPELTARRFVRDPFRYDGVMFNTGDLGRWTPQGVLEHLGRVDDQVKVKGFRVELDGVACAMQTTPGVAQAVALLVEGELWGFACPSTADVDLLRKRAAGILPYYAVPSQFVTLDNMPLTNNGKIDKSRLRAMASRASSAVPSTPMVEQCTKPAARRGKSTVLRALLRLLGIFSRANS